MLKFPARRLFAEKEMEAIKSVFEYYGNMEKDFGYQGYFEELYTSAFIEYMGGYGCADAVSTGSAALFVAVASLQLEPNSEVLVSPITDPGTLSAIILNNLKPKLIDSASQRSYNIDVNSFLGRVNDATKAIMVVHSGGRAVEMPQIASFAESHGLKIIEDCSQAHGASVGGKKIGTFGDIAAFSTMFSKNHSTGGCGGIVYSKERTLYPKIRAYADRGKNFFSPDFDEKNPTDSLFPALNLNLDELSCAIGISTLKKLDEVRLSRIRFLRILDEKLSNCSTTCKLRDIADDDSPFFHQIFVGSDKLKCSKREFATKLKNMGLPVNPHYNYVVSKWRWIQKYLADCYETKNAIDCCDNSFNLLFNENFTENDADKIASLIARAEIECAI